MGFNRACSFAGAATSLIRSVQRRSRCSLRSFRYFCQPDQCDAGRAYCKFDHRD
jgi:hypothetical protein